MNTGTKVTTHDKYELPPLPEDLIASMMLASEVRSLMRRYGERCASAAIEADREASASTRKHRGEPVAWLYIGPSGNISSAYDIKPGDDLYSLARAEGGVIKPLFDSPQPAEPVAEVVLGDDGIQIETIAGRPLRLGDKLYSAPQPLSDSDIPAEPDSLEPLLDMIDTLCNGLEWNIKYQPEAMNDVDDEALEEARALLAKYGRSRDEGM